MTPNSWTSSWFSQFLPAILVCVATASSAFAEGWLAGPSPNGGALEHEAVLQVPQPVDRTIFGIGEIVSLEIGSWSDIDIYVDEFNEEWEIEDTLGEVAWYVEGPGYVEPAVGTATFYYAPFSRVNDSGCVQVVVPDSGTRGLDGYTNDQLSFNVRIPSGVRAWHANDYSLGTLGPPDNSIGTASDFWFQTLPDNVNFQRVSFRESISQQTFAWPDGTSYAVGQSTRGFLVQDLDGPNFYGDLVSSGGPWRTERLLNQVYQSCQFNVTQSLQFYAEGDWHTYATPAHPRRFSGDTFKARVGWSDIWGNWQGPYQEPGL